MEASLTCSNLTTLVTEKLHVKLIFFEILNILDNLIKQFYLEIFFFLFHLRRIGKLKRRTLEVFDATKQ